MSKEMPIKNDDRPQISDAQLEQIITGKPKAKPKGKLFLVAAFLIVILFGFGTLLVSLIGRIRTNNLTGGSQLLKALPGLNVNALKGEGDGRINVLLLGIGGSKHPGGQLSDTIMVASIDSKNKEAAFLSIPRDLYVSYPKPLTGAGKINAVHAYGEQQKSPGGGPELMKKTVDNLLDLPIQYFIRVDFDGFRQLVDSIGGVTVNVEKALYDPLFPAANMVDYEPFSVPVGLQNFDGKTALKYARSRETTSDFDRARRQQQIISAIKEKILTSRIVLNPAKILELTSIVGNHVKTDMTVGELQRLFSIAKDIPHDKIISRVLDTAAGGPLYSESTEQGYFIMPRDPTGQEIKTIAHNIFKDPFVSSENATIEIQNASSINGAGSILQQELTALGYKVNKLEKASVLSETTQIIDLTSGKKPISLNYLTNRLQAKRVTTNVISQSDFIIIIGNDYANRQTTKK